MQFLVQCSIGYADKENLGIGSSYSGNLTGLQKGSGDDKAQLQQKELAEVLDIMKINRQQHDDIEKEKEELKKIYEEKMKVINEKRKKNNKDYDDLLERSNSLKDSLGIERNLTFLEKVRIGVIAFEIILYVLLGGFGIMLCLAILCYDKTVINLGDVADALSAFVEKIKAKFSNCFSLEGNNV